MEYLIVYYSISLLIGCFTAYLINLNMIYSMICIICFLVAMYLTMSKKFFYLNIAFFMCGFLSFNFYFDFSLVNNTEVRILEVKGETALGSVSGRNILLNGNVKDLKVGYKTFITGSFKKQNIYERGIIGIYDIKSYEICEEDLKSLSYRLKEHINKSLAMSLTENEAALTRSLSFGDTSLLSEEQKLTFKNLGVVHAVSVSGLHISIIYKAVEGIAGTYLGVLISLLYVLFSGSKSSAFRAFIMILILKLSKKIYKNYNGICALSFAFMLLLFAKPYYFMDMGFCLSFLATLGIILYYSNIQRALYRLPDVLRSPLSLTLSAQIFTLPYLGLSMGTFNWSFIAGNIFLIPIYSLLVIIGNLGVLFLWVPNVFKLICYVIKIICMALEGGYYLLLNGTSLTTNFGQREAICFFIIYLSFVMIKYGYKRFKFIPIFIVISLIFSYCTLFPEINIIKFKDIEAIIIKDKFNSTMAISYPITEGKYVIKLEEYYNIHNIVSYTYKDIPLSSKLKDLKISNSIKDNIIKLKNQSNKYGKKNIYYHYDIIDKDVVKVSSYKIFFGRPINWRWDKI